MFHIVLFEPEIPPNTGNIMRLCANTHCHLHLIHPLGFSMAEKSLRRAGLDYREWVNVKEYNSLDEFYQSTNTNQIYACTTKAKHHYNQIRYNKKDALLFGPETRGLPESILNQFDDQHKIKIPMAQHSRSLNLSNSVAVITYEAWRQNDFYE